MNYADPAREERVIDSGRYFLITVFGMIGSFAAIVRAPISGVIIVYEMTNVGKTRADLIFPSLFTAVIAYIVSTEMQEKDIYEIILERTGLYDLSEELQDMEEQMDEEAATPPPGQSPDDEAPSPGDMPRTRPSPKRVSIGAVGVKSPTS